MNAKLSDKRLAKLAVVAISIHLFEAAIPSIIPGLKPGLANVITLIVFYQYGFGAAAWVNMLRVIGGSLFLGSFLTPGFFLSFSGALATLVVLKIMASIRCPFSVIGVSVVCACAHVGAQLILAYYLFIQHPAIFNLTPFFIIGATVLGTVSGFVAYYALELQKQQGPASAPE